MDIKVKEIKAPNEIPFSGVHIFLAGTIDNGDSADWQSKIQSQIEAIDYYVTKKVYLINPRREDWNPNAGSIELKKQINWELSAIGDSDIVIFNFEDNSKSPITLLELGMCLATFAPEYIFVRVTPQFYRYQNVITTCEFFNCSNIFQTTEQLINSYNFKKALE